MKTLKISDEEIKLIMACLSVAQRDAIEKNEYTLRNSPFSCVTPRLDSCVPNYKIYPDEVMSINYIEMRRKIEDLHNKLRDGKLEIQTNIL